MSEKKKLDAEVLCYTDSKIDRFFLEIQGSGKVLLDNKMTMFVGFENQNGHKYRAIGKYLVSIGALRLEEVSLQSIRAWLDKNPSRVDEVLNYNESMVFFQQRTQGATGALGVELTPKRSVAIDRRFIPLGSMLYVDAKFKEKSLSKVVFAQDTGGAIKGALRADLFLGSGEEALEIAGYLKAPLQVWILLPKARELAKL
jgi:membrane-bound lytic murein transglycosylase A